MIAPKLHAWAWSTSADEIPGLLRPFQGHLSAILYPAQYEADIAYPIAYVSSLQHAEAAMQARGDWRAVIVRDEPNLRQTPAEYADQVREVIEHLAEYGHPVCTAPLAVTGGWWRTLWFNQRFDDDYHHAVRARLPLAELAGVNVDRSNLHEVRRILRLTPERWIVTAIPYRNWVNNVLMSLFGITVSQWVELASDPRIHTIGIWCLKTGTLRDGSWQSQFGIYDQHGRLSRVGRQLRRALVG